jgi:hypothetical protein
VTKRRAAEKSDNISVGEIYIGGFKKSWDNVIRLPDHGG